MDKYGFIAIIFIFLSVSITCDATLVFHLRKLIANEGNNASATSQVPPIASPVNGSNTNTNTSSINTEKPQLDKQKESLTVNQTNSNQTLPVDPKGSSKHDNGTNTIGAPSPAAGEKNSSGVGVDGGNNGKVNATMPMPDDNGSCDGSISRCMEQGMLSCIKASKDAGSKDLFLVVKNEGEITLKVNVKVLQNNLADIELPKHTSKKIDILSSVGKRNKLIVSSGGAPCELFLSQSVSVDKIIQQLSFYSKQVTPIYAVYASFLVTLLLGGTWACCRLRKRKQQDEVPYQELEMGIPESASAANLYGSEGWDHDWDDDWDEEIAVKSPSGHQVRSVSADGLTSRSPPPKRDKWENGWDD